MHAEPNRRSAVRSLHSGRGPVATLLKPSARSGIAERTSRLRENPEGPASRPGSMSSVPWAFYPSRPLGTGRSGRGPAIELLDVEAGVSRAPGSRVTTVPVRLRPGRAHEADWWPPVPGGVVADNAVLVNELSTRGRPERGPRGDLVHSAVQVVDSAGAKRRSDEVGERRFEQDALRGAQPATRTQSTNSRCERKRGGRRGGDGNRELGRQWLPLGDREDDGYSAELFVVVFSPGTGSTSIRISCVRRNRARGSPEDYTLRLTGLMRSIVCFFKIGVGLCWIVSVTRS